MEIQLHAIDFAVVGSVQQKYYDEKTNDLFNSQKNLKRLFDGVSDIILRRGQGFIMDLIGSKPLPEFQDYLLILDFPKSYFKKVLLELKFLLEEIQDDWHFNDAVDPQMTMPLYRNIKHLIFVLAYQTRIKGFEFC